MFAQAIASVFSASGICPIQRYRPIQSKPEDKTPVSTRIDQNSSIVEFSQNAENMLEASKIAGLESKDNKSKNAKKELTEEEKKRVEDLKKRDREVKRHEQAHVAAAGRYAKGGPQFEYEKGPDGNQYAVGGQVKIDTSPIKGDPDATIEKARIVKKAALAPSDPSAEDKAVAAEASKMEAQARIEKSREENSQSNPNTQNTSEALKPESDLYSKKASSPEFEYANSGIKGYNRFPEHGPGELINMFA